MYKLRIKILEHWHITLVRPQIEHWSTVWSPYTKENKIKLERFAEGQPDWVSNDYSTCNSVTDLGWRSLENRRYDACLAMFYKTVYGLVAVPVPSYFERPEVYVRHMHPLADKFIRLSVTIILSHDSSYDQPCTSIIRHILFLTILLTPNTFILLSYHYHPFYPALSLLLTFHTNTPCAHGSGSTQPVSISARESTRHWVISRPGQHGLFFFLANCDALLVPIHAISHTV